MIARGERRTGGEREHDVGEEPGHGATVTRYDRRVRALASGLTVLFVLAARALAGPAPIHIKYDSAHLDLDKHVLQFQPSRTVTEATIVAIGDDGSELGNGSATYTGRTPTPWLAISWTQPEHATVMMLKLRVEASDGAAVNVDLVPWSVTVEHEDVNFRTDSAVIDPDEAKKLDASLAKIEDIVKHAEKFMKVRLYIAGHTDTVGPSAKNRRLSLERAKAIGRYFRAKGLTVAIAVAGFGEDVPKVPTRDNTDERANRRADYVIGPAGGAPPFGGAYLQAKAAWLPLGR